MTGTPTRVPRLMLLAALVFAMWPSTGTAAAAEADDNVPGVGVTTSPISAHLDSVSDPDDVRSVWLEAGDTLNLTLSRAGTPTAGFWPNLYLYGPTTTDIRLFSPIRNVEGTFQPKSIAYTAPVKGTYFIDMYAPDTETRESGDVVLAWTVLRPVFRFYNAGKNTHFYTPSADERAIVNAKWPHIFTDEGVAYYMNPFNNTTPLYRFYNRVSGSHFYTPSAEERAIVNAKWPHIFTDEGATYYVNSWHAPNSIPVYRFYNKRNGSHFYAASAGERDYVNAHWPEVYTDEGVGFYIGQ